MPKLYPPLAGGGGEKLAAVQLVYPSQNLSFLLHSLPYPTLALPPLLQVSHICLFRCFLN